MIHSYYLHILFLLVIFSLPGCTSSDDGSPDGAVKAFLQAAAFNDTEEVYRLLATETRRQLDSRAVWASRQTGGRRTLLPRELLLLGLSKPRYEVHRVELLEKKGDRARVRLVGASLRGKSGTPASEILRLVREGRRWRLQFDLWPEPGPASSTHPGAPPPP